MTVTPKGWLTACILSSEPIVRLLEVIDEAALPGAYLAAGCVAQTAWNALYGYPITYGIEDADVVYFDADDLSAEAEAAEEARLAAQLGAQVPFCLDVKNEARVHLWYRAKFGYDIAPYASCEVAIESFPTTATAVGIRLAAGGLRVWSPYGLEDLLGGIVRANRRQVTEAIFRAKADKWQRKWPRLEVLPWERGR